MSSSKKTRRFAHQTLPRLGNTVTATVTMPRPVLARVDAFAEREDISRSRAIAELLDLIVPDCGA